MTWLDSITAVEFDELNCAVSDCSVAERSDWDSVVVVERGLR